VRRYLLLVLAVALGTAPAARAQERQAEEHEVKAAFLFKFPAFVEWPAKPGPEVPFVVAVVGAEEVAGQLRTLARGRTHDGRQIEVRDAADPQAIAGAHVVYVGRAAAARLPAIARALGGAPVLVVSESAGALEQGSMINFVLADGRVRFDVALDSAETARLRISPRLLAVARSVRGARL
jgi:hypothetical protein